jgi:hypothetical protein
VLFKLQCRLSFLCLHGLAASAPSPPPLAQTPHPHIMNQKEHEKTPRSVEKLCFSLLLSSIDRNHLLPIRTNVSALSFQQAQAPIFKYPLCLHRPSGAINSRFLQAVWQLLSGPLMRRAPPCLLQRRNCREARQLWRLKTRKVWCASESCGADCVTI